jgi:hypothetical protein
MNVLKRNQLNVEIMKRICLCFSVLIICAMGVNGQYKKDGTPDMRYKTNKTNHGNAYSVPRNSYYTNSTVRYQSAYIKKNGTYVESHYKTKRNATNWDNFSTKGNYNYYKGTTGSRAKDYSPNALNYGNQRIIYTGPKGGQYYYNSNGNKTYVPKR